MSLYLCHAIGFFLQFYPCTVLCLIPAGEESFRYSKRKIYLGVTLAVAVLSALFPPVVSAGGWNTNIYMVANVYMLAAVVLYAVLYFWIVREAVSKKLVVLFLVIFYAVSQFVLVVLLQPFVEHWSIWSIWIDTFPYHNIYGSHTVFLWVVLDAVMVPLAVWAFGHVVRDFIQEIDTRNMKQEFALVLVSTVFYLVSVIWFDSVVATLSLDIRIMACPMFLILMLEQCLVYFLLLRESVRRRRDSEHQKALEIQHLQYGNITREMENASQMRHDMRHWLGGLNNLLEQDKLDEMKEYLAQVIDQTARRESKTYCRNTTVNGLLQYYVGIAQSAGIRCLVQADCGDLTISPTDLTVIIGNAMENAIRACENFPDNRYISIQVGTISGSLAIQIENPCLGVHPSGKYRLEGGFLPAAAFLSARAGGGYGLKSLEHTARKYGGDASFRYDETKKTFTTRVRLNLHPEMLV